MKNTKGNMAVLNMLSRDIYGRPYNMLDEDEQYHIDTELIGMDDLMNDLINGL